MERDDVSTQITTVWLEHDDMESSLAQTVSQEGTFYCL